MGSYGGPDIVQSGLVFAVDAGSTRSYPGSGTTGTDLINSETIALENGVGFSSANGGSWDFDGVNDYIDLPDSLITDLNGGTKASLCMWIKNDSVNNGAGNAGLIQLSGYNNGNGNLWFYSNGYTYLDIFRTARVETVFLNSIVPAQSWVMLAVTTTPGTNGWKCYINGVLRKQVGGENTVAVSNIQGGLTLGCSSDSRYTNGKIPNCLIYNSELTAAEVLQNYNAQKNRFL
jgi:hypothetical protein